MPRHKAFVGALLCLAAAANAAVVETGASGFLSTHEVTVSATPADAYEALVAEVRRPADARGDGTEQWVAT